MKIKRFFAADIRHAMRMVKEELGADAVIMSNRSVDGGVEIVAARDFDEHAVEKHLQQQEQELHKIAPKPLEFPDLHADKHTSHLLSSARKPGNAVENPLRKNIDQYIGYAEKVQIMTAAPVQAKENKQAQTKPAWANAEQKLKLVAENAKLNSQDQVPDKFIVEIRNEIKDLRSMLDNKLAGMSEAKRNHELPVRAALLERLLENGFSKKLSTKIANRLGSHTQLEHAFIKAQEMLCKSLPIVEDRLLQNGGIAALVGPTGVGKTTTIAKLAAQYILKHGNRDVALITTDNYRIGAHEQLSIYGRILGVSVKIANNGAELAQHIHHFSDKKLILIDTVGMSQRDLRLAEQINTLRHEDLPIQTFLVISATSQYKTVMEVIDAFQILEPHAAILTKLDEGVSKASALSAIIERRLPLSFITDGQQVPEDIYEPEAEALIQRCVMSCNTEYDYNDKLNQDDWLAESYA
ncbi:flagellar biosynthesis protein FlhF [Methylomonas sp. AM2-LC]|uniref:flagellar biosynthesis protein FlhF n=1 Tax=Methylomonas sp. AM2-LC TaxID=3153301 RepID=UPI0032630999